VTSTVALSVSQTNAIILAHYMKWYNCGKSNCDHGLSACSRICHSQRL